ncbi:hypothetical protein B9G53_08135 [Pseudanabaena sp. SR411]|nr:hypothetical protein B9G53_08135 [Pseudanabaena sp. SR411]
MIFNQWDRAIANIYPNLGIRISAPPLDRLVAMIWQMSVSNLSNSHRFAIKLNVYHFANGCGFICQTKNNHSNDSEF